AAGRTTVNYLVRCALPAGHSIRKQDQAGNWVTFTGELGFGAGWENGACDKTCQEGVSACMMARINTAGVHIPLWLDSPAPSIGWGRSTYYPNQEGTFFGNIFTPNPATGKLDAFYCNGPGFAQSVVPGRLGAFQSGAPYTNPFGTNAACANNCIAADSPHQGDGYKSCKGYNTPVTVWREPAPTFDPTTTYRVCAQHSGRCLDISGASKLDGAPVVQWGFASTDNQKFKVTSLGDGFYSFCAKNSGKCLDTHPPSGGDGSTVVQWAWDGSDSQRWAISSVGDGWFAIMVKEGSQSLDVYGASYADGAKIGQYPYSGAQNQTFRIDYSP
ncbi:MAG TPA: RICIN domain-containing protein, partial [Polyangia bacterium]|nr:RICIN domain-containing protein [Polyangia bacterium]